jgi:hypothetical protein
MEINAKFLTQFHYLLYPILRVCGITWTKIEIKTIEFVLKNIFPNKLIKYKWVDLKKWTLLNFIEKHFATWFSTNPTFPIELFRNNLKLHNIYYFLFTKAKKELNIGNENWMK